MSEQSEIESQKKTIEILQAQLSDPPIDVQELVIRKLNLVHRDALNKWKECAENLAGELERVSEILPHPQDQESIRLHLENFNQLENLSLLNR